MKLAVVYHQIFSDNRENVISPTQILNHSNNEENYGINQV